MPRTPPLPTRLPQTSNHPPYRTGAVQLTCSPPLQLLRLWESVPARFALCSPLLLYTSSEHGFSLKTFYQRVGMFEPTVLLLRTTDGEVFGAYCSTSWNTRNQLLEDGSRQAYFGTGELASSVRTGGAEYP